MGADGKPVMEEQTSRNRVIAQGPVASQVAIKMLGTNGGGFMNANAAHPFENPTPLSNFLQMLSIFSIGSGLTYYLGRMVKNQRTAGRCGRDDGAISGRHAALLVGRGRRQSRFISNSASPPPTATWKARKSASAFSIPRCSPR